MIRVDICEVQVRKFLISLPVAIFAAGFITPTLALTNRELWKGPGAYEVIRTEDGFMIYSKPYPSEAVCQTAVNKKYANKEYAENMRKKYGPKGDYKRGYELYCIEMKTREDAPPR